VGLIKLEFLEASEWCLNIYIIYLQHFWLYYLCADKAISRNCRSDATWREILKEGIVNGFPVNMYSYLSPVKAGHRRLLPLGNPQWNSSRCISSRQSVGFHKPSIPEWMPWHDITYISAKRNQSTKNLGWVQLMKFSRIFFDDRYSMVQPSSNNRRSSKAVLNKFYLLFMT
jgi:hypothetical protein